MRSAGASGARAPLAPSPIAPVPAAAARAPALSPPGSYGGLARFRDLRRLQPVSERTLVGASGEYSDFQYLLELLDELRVDDRRAEDGISLSADEVHSYITRVLYNRRNKMDPLWNAIIVAGLDDEGKPCVLCPSRRPRASAADPRRRPRVADPAPPPPRRRPRTASTRSVLGKVDMIGTAYTENFLATGFGAHLAVPIMRERWSETLTEGEARAILTDCLRVLYYRDCRTLNRVQMAKVSGDGIVVSEPFAIKTKWDFESFVKPKAGADTGGSW